MAPLPATRAAALARWLGYAAQGVFFAGYPLIVYFGTTRFGARGAALLLLGLALPGLLRALWRSGARAKGLVSVGSLGVALLALAAALRDTRFMLAYPTVVSLALLGQFGASLWRGPPMVERFARLQEPELSEAKVRHCRAVTWVWCGFFLANGAAAAGLALWAPQRWWALYTGGLSYVLMGALFAGEYLVRTLRFGGDGAVARALSVLRR